MMGLTGTLFDRMSDAEAEEWEDDQAWNHVTGYDLGLDEGEVQQWYFDRRASRSHAPVRRQRSADAVPT